MFSKVTLSLAVLSLFLAACAPFEVPANAPTGQPQSANGEPRPAQIDTVAVEIGLGSPIPAHVMIGGTLPSPCDQVAQVLQTRVGAEFRFTVLTTTSAGETCPPDALPFTLRAPLNMVGVGAGEYTIDVNGVRAPLSWAFGDPAPVVAATEGAPTVAEASVDSVDVVIGNGSPLPVHLVVSGTLPNTCSRLGEVALRRIGTQGLGFDLDLVSYSYGGPDCIADTVPFRLEFPLNVVSLPDGPATVTVNGIEASVDWRAALKPVGTVLAQVDAVEVELGLGSPVPAWVDVYGNFPNTCSQIDSVSEFQSGDVIAVTIRTTDPAQSDACRADLLPFHTRLPLNALGLAEGSTTVIVNGVAATLAR